MKKLNVSGYRGIWGEDLNEQIAFEFGIAFARFLKKKNNNSKIIIGRDARITGPKILNALAQAFDQENIVYEYAGIIPTPSILLAIRKNSFDGGIIITASHNPKEYNGLKFANEKGLFLDEKEIIEVNKERESISGEFFTEKIKDLKENDIYSKQHVEEILKNIDIKKIKEKKFKIVHDPINSAGSFITKELLEMLNCEVIQINKETNGLFAHKPEPLKENLYDLSQEVIRQKADIGFAQDPDADRLVVVNENGEILNEEYTLALALKNILKKENNRNKKICINMSTSKICEDIATENGYETIRTKIGEANVVNAIIENYALAGGEGSGGVIYPIINSARDSLVGIVLILELLARENKKISTLAKEIPVYFMKKDKIIFTGEIENIYNSIKNLYPEAQTNTLDGLRLDITDEGWIHIRPSNTEPIIRIILELKTEEKLNTVFEEIKLTLGS